MANMQLYRNFVREEQFTRLVAARNAAVRWELRRTRILFEIKLERMGAWQDEYGVWHLPDLPAAGTSQPY